MRFNQRFQGAFGPSDWSRTSGLVVPNGCSNLVLHVHENHLTLSAPENLLSGALFSAVSKSSKGGCGQTCGRMENAPVDSRCFAAIPGSVWIVALFHRKVKAVSDSSALIFCAAVDKEIRNQRNTAFVFSKSCFSCCRMNKTRQFLC